MTTRILVVEDAQGIQELISVNLRSAGYEVWNALSAEAASDRLMQALPDLILLDWMLPGMSGVEYMRVLRGDPRTAQIPVIMLSARAEERDKIVGLEIGADDYMTKPFSPRELLARMTAVLRRRAPQATQDMVKSGRLALDPTTKVVTVDGHLIDVGPTEFRLLHYFMTHGNRVHSREHLLDQVWGDQYFGNQRTVDVHIRRLRAAMEEAGLNDPIRTIRGSGYLFNN